MIGRDAIPELTSLVLMACLLVFQRSSTEPGKFAHPWYLLASVCTPNCALANFERDTIGCTPSLSTTDSSGNTIELNDDTLRTFPVAMVFHAIVTFSHWFMGMQLAARRKDLASIKEMRARLADASEQNKKLK